MSTDLSCSLISILGMHLGFRSPHQTQVPPPSKVPPVIPEVQIPPLVSPPPTRKSWIQHGPPNKYKYIMSWKTISSLKVSRSQHRQVSKQEEHRDTILSITDYFYYLDCFNIQEGGSSWYYWFHTFRRRFGYPSQIADFSCSSSSSSRLFQRIFD